MSDALTPEAPEPLAVTPAVADQAPVDGTAVASGSAGTATTSMVEAERFNGLMSSHQKVLTELEQKNQLVAALEARLTQQETPEVADSAEEVAALRAELQEERLERAKAAALAKYPGAAPLADLIVGNSAKEIEDVTAAIAQRLLAIVPAATEAAPAAEVEGAPAVEAVAAEGVPAPAVAPAVAGGVAAPAADENATAKVQEALRNGDWNGFWEARAGQVATANLS